MATRIKGLGNAGGRLPPANGAAVVLADRAGELRESQARFRSDVHVSRQVSRGEVVYQVHDPVSFQTHRLDEQQYGIALRLNGNTSLREVFEELVQKEVLGRDEEQLFYDYVGRLYQSGLVVLPVHNGAQFYDRYEKSRAVKRSNGLASLLFLQVPLGNPDRFLDHTCRHVSGLFSRWFLLVWCGSLGLAAAVVVSRFRDLAEPLNGILSTSNLPVLWLTLIGLKLWHELGHAYACKLFGGCVPEWGTYLVAGNPLAYVDATATWSFPDRSKRLVVMAAGMYFESLVAIPALFVWAMSDGPMSSLAFQVVVAASVVTVLFNANPLMRFDGYFILTELIRLPNLRTRASRQVNCCLQRIVLGRTTSRATESGLRSAGLLAYGLSAAVYRIFLVLSIAMLVASRFPLVGLAIAVAYLFMAAGSSSKKVLQFLLRQEETLQVRIRARAAAAVLFLGAPLAVATLPVPFPVICWGVVAVETEHRVRVGTPGEFLGSAMLPGQFVAKGDCLAQLANHTFSDRLAEVRAALEEAHLKWEVVRDRDVVESTRVAGSIEILRRQLREVNRQYQLLRVAAPGEGVLLRVLPDNQRGRFLERGEEVGLLANGKPLLRAWLTQEQLQNIATVSGLPVKFRIPGHSADTFVGRLKEIVPAADSVVDEPALSAFAGGGLLIDPQTGRPVQTLFRIEIDSISDVITLQDYGGRAVIALPRRYQSIFSWVFGKCRRFVEQLWLA